MELRKQEETKTHYEQYPFIEGGETRIAWWQEYLSYFLPDELTRGSLIGDIGCGVGEILRGLSNRGAQMVGLDLTLAALRRNQEINPDAQLFNGSAINLPFANNTFDHTISIGVLMVTPDCRKGFAEVARVTSPGGMVVLFIYNYWCYLHLLYRLFAPVRRVVPLESVPPILVRSMQPFVRSHLNMEIDEPQLRRLLGDKLWTPHATFHTLSQMRRWGTEEGLTLERWKRFYHGYANVMTFKKKGVRREGGAKLELRCLRCNASPVGSANGGYQCGSCGASYPRHDGIFHCLS
jgi:ubiquinone/menaquinone biosynthesis C-methylase UbiE